jgi:hypothetical protein
MNQAQGLDHLSGEAEIQFLIVMEVRELLALIEECGSTGHL